MNHGAPHAQGHQRQSRLLVLLPWLVLFGVSLLWRSILIDRFPEVYPWDPLTRVVDRDRWFVRHWLPVPQAPLVLGSDLGWSLHSIRLVYASIGALAAVAVGATIARITSYEAVGLATGLLLSLAPVFVGTTIVPYQEGFMVLTAAAAVWGLFELAPARQKAATGPRTSLWLVGIALSIGALVRYELWLLAGYTLSLGMSKDWRKTGVHLSAVPAIGIAGLWIVSTPFRHAGVGTSPNRLVVRREFAPAGPELIQEFVGDFLSVIHSGVQMLTLLGVGLALLGIAHFHRLSRQGTMLAVAFAAVTTGLATIRVFNSGVLTARMLMVPLLITLPFVALGLWRIRVQLPGKRVGVAVSSGLLLFLGVVYLINGSGMIRRSAVAVAPERRAALLLEALADSVTVEILPRQLSNPWNESTSAAIFGNSTNLDPWDPRFIYSEGQRVSEATDPDFMLYWCAGDYHLRPPALVPLECRQASVDEISQESEREQL